MDSYSSLFLFIGKFIMKKVALFWSAGKDSAMALYKLKQDPDIIVKAVVTTLNDEYRRISMHGIRETLLDKQCDELGYPLIKMWVPNDPDNGSYETAFLNLAAELKADGVDTLVFGDIFLDDLREYRENLVKKVGIKAYFPLWKISTKQLVKEFSDLGFKAITCCVQSETLGSAWTGRQLDIDFFNTLPSAVDPCGENGEYHTFCYDGPVFNKRINYTSGEIVFKPLNIQKTDGLEVSGFYYIDLV